MKIRFMLYGSNDYNGYTVYIEANESCSTGDKSFLNMITIIDNMIYEDMSDIFDYTLYDNVNYDDMIVEAKNDVRNEDVSQYNNFVLLGNMEYNNSLSALDNFEYNKINLEYYIDKESVNKIDVKAYSNSIPTDIIIRDININKILA